MLYLYVRTALSFPSLQESTLINENIIFIMMVPVVCPLGVEGSLTELTLGRLALALFSWKSILTRYDVL